MEPTSLSPAVILTIGAAMTFGSLLFSCETKDLKLEEVGQNEIVRSGRAGTALTIVSAALFPRMSVLRSSLALLLKKAIFVPMLLAAAVVVASVGIGRNAPIAMSNS